MLQIILFALPFVLYAAWLRHGGQPITPSRVALGLAVVGVTVGILAAFLYDSSRSLDRDQRYVPAQIRDGGTIR